MHWYQSSSKKAKSKKQKEKEPTESSSKKGKNEVAKKSLPTKNCTDSDSDGNPLKAQTRNSEANIQLLFKDL